VEPGVVGTGTATQPTRRVGGEKPLHLTSGRFTFSDSGLGAL